MAPFRAPPPPAPSTSTGPLPVGAPSASALPANPCPEEMVLVSGKACPEVEHTCLKWLDPPPYQNLRCGTYAASPKCLAPRTPMRFCVDREEHVEPGEKLPAVDVSFVDAKARCTAMGRHLCREREWVFACEGEEMRPYPYGFSRDSTACNIDQTNLGRPGRGLRDLRAPVSAFPRCLSPFGVHDMTGNVDEWVERESGPQRSVLHGGWWLPGRNRCRATTAEHGPEYKAKQVGFRCCKDTAS